MSAVEDKETYIEEEEMDEIEVPGEHHVFKVTRGTQQYQVIVPGTEEEGRQKIKAIEPAWAQIEHLQRCEGAVESFLEANKNRVCSRASHIH
jgi:hypothetical protein